MDAVGLKRLRTAWELIFSYAFLVSCGLLMQAGERSTLILSLLYFWALLFLVSYLLGSYDLEIGPAYGIRMRTEAVYVAGALLYFASRRLLIPGLVLFPWEFWVALFLYLNLGSPALGLVGGKLSRVPTLCVFDRLTESEHRAFGYWGYKCGELISPDELPGWLRRNSDERNRPAGCEIVLFDLRRPGARAWALEQSRLFFVDFVGVRGSGLLSYLSGRHCEYIHFMPLAGFNRRLKRAVDLVLSVVALIVLSPVLAVIVVAIKLDTPGPVFYKHRRLGKDMRYFWLLKFRTMYRDADQRLQRLLAEDPKLKHEFETTYKLRNDPRVTTVGRFLRRASIDELPQLFNIIKDQMSLVGPRPIVAGEIPFYKSCNLLPFRVTPGATGLWQISGRNETSYERRVELDVQYVTRWSYWKDLKILVGTIPAVLSRRGAY